LRTLWLRRKIFCLRRHAVVAGPIKHIKGDIQMPLSQDK